MSLEIFDQFDMLFEKRSASARYEGNLCVVNLVGGNKLRRYLRNGRTEWLEVVFPEPDSASMLITRGRMFNQGDIEVLCAILHENMHRGF